MTDWPAFQEDLYRIWPEIVLAVTLVLALVSDILLRGRETHVTGWITLIGSAFSVCFWANGTSTDDDRVLSLSSASSTAPLFTLGTGAASLGNTEKLRMYLRSDSNAAHARYSSQTVFDNTWHHVAGTYDGANEILS